jgi:hypothetical protein
MKTPRSLVDWSLNCHLSRLRKFLKRSRKPTTGVWSILVSLVWNLCSGALRRARQEYAVHLTGAARRVLKTRSSSYVFGTLSRRNSLFRHVPRSHLNRISGLAANRSSQRWARRFRAAGALGATTLAHAAAAKNTKSAAPAEREIRRSWHTAAVTIRSVADAMLENDAIPNTHFCVFEPATLLG